jgi:pre-rRNA-processing protein TSR1
MQGLSTSAPNPFTTKKMQALAKLSTRYFHSLFEGEPKVLHMDCINDTANLLRWIGNGKVKELPWRDQRAYLMAENINVIRSSDPSSDLCSVQLTGFLRGEKTISANHLVHVTGFGDFQVR